MDDVAPEYVAARTVLLDALVTLDGHLDNLVLVGAQAVYHHTRSADLNVPLMTTDADLAVNTSELADVPEIGVMLRAAGFTRNLLPRLPRRSNRRPSLRCPCQGTARHAVSGSFAVRHFVSVPTPAGEHLVDVLTGLFPGFVTRHAAHEQRVVVGVVVANGCNDRQLHRALIETLPRGGTTDSAAASCGGVCGNRGGTLRWASGQ